MIPAVYDMVTVDLVPAAEPAAGRFRATGSTLVVPGFIAVYQEGRTTPRTTTATACCRR